MIRILLTPDTSEKFLDEPLGLFIFEDQLPLRGFSGLVDQKVRRALAKELLDGKLKLEPGKCQIRMNSDRDAFSQLMILTAGKLQENDPANMRLLIGRMTNQMLAAGASRFGIAVSDIAIQNKTDLALAEALFKGIRRGVIQSRSNLDPTIRVYWPEQKIDSLIKELTVYKQKSPDPDEWKIEKDIEPIEQSPPETSSEKPPEKPIDNL